MREIARAYSGEVASVLRRDLGENMKATTTRALSWRRSKLDLRATYNGRRMRADRATEGSGKREGFGWRKRRGSGKSESKRGIGKI